MKYDLVSYLKKHFEDRDVKLKKPDKEGGPVITISRQYGCPAKHVAEKLSEKLTEMCKNREYKVQWKWIGKEILAEAAKELNVEPSRIKYIFNYEQRGIIDDIVAINHDITKSFHIYLEAPLELRALRVSERYNISIPKAKDYATDIDKKRKQFREQFEGKNTDYTTFDMSFNCMTLSVDEIVNIISHTVALRNLLC